LAAAAAGGGFGVVSGGGPGGAGGASGDFGIGLTLNPRFSSTFLASPIDLYTAIRVNLTALKKTESLPCSYLRPTVGVAAPAAHGGRQAGA